MRRVLTTLLVVVASLAAVAPALGAARLAYVTGHGINNKVWLAQVDGSHASKLGGGNAPLVSPDGTTVAASLFGPKGPALVIYKPGSPTKHYFDLGKFSATPVAWSPDSRYLAVSTLSAAVTGNAGTGLSVIDMQTGKVQTLTTGAICGASFAPSGTDRLVYGRSPARINCFKQNDLFMVNADGSGGHQVTHNGRSLNPLWGARGIAFDRSTPRGKLNAPAYQVWMMRGDGTHARQITHMKIPQLVDGLMPTSFSANGKRMLATYVGQDTEYAWTLNVATGRAREVKVHGNPVQSGAISSDGSRVLIDFGAFMQSPSHGTVATVPFGGGPAKVLARHADQPSWNG